MTQNKNKNKNKSNEGPRILDCRDIWVSFLDNSRFPHAIWKNPTVQCIVRLKKYCYLVLDYDCKYYMTEHRDGSGEEEGMERVIPLDSEDMQLAHKIFHYIRGVRYSSAITRETLHKTILEYIDSTPDLPFLRRLKREVYPIVSRTYIPSFPGYASVAVVAPGAKVSGCDFTGCTASYISVTHK